MILRKTDNYTARRHGQRGVRIMAVDANTGARGESKIVSLCAWYNLNMLPDSLFDEACARDLGIEQANDNDGCEECERSHGPHYSGRCEH